MKNLILTLFLTLLGMPASAAGLTDMTAAERTAFRAEVRAYLLDNPEVLMEALQVLDQRQKAAKAQGDADLVATNAHAIFNDGFSYVGGNPKGDITLVEFQDYRCTYCRRAHNEVKELVKSDGRIRFVLKEFPILGQNSTISSRMAVATLIKAGPAAYVRLTDFLITFNGTLNKPTIRAILKKFKIDADVVMNFMDSPEVSARIAKTHALALRLQISGTPTFVLGGQMLRGYVPLATMRKLVAAARERTN